MSIILSIDQGTTSTRVIAYDKAFNEIASHAVPLQQIYPANGWVEHDPEEIWQAVLSCQKNVISQIDVDQLVSLGITNQRETVVAWNRKTGEPLHNAIVWQDRRTSEFCNRLKDDGFESEVTQKTGLKLDPYFSASKMNWLLQNSADVQAAQQAKRLNFGTIDSWLIFKLTGNQQHLTDATNASRTSLYNINSGEWDEELLSMFGVPADTLPSIQDTHADFGFVQPEFTGGKALPILGVAGDQHAALFGQACLEPGSMKITFGTGAFAMLNTGDTPVASSQNLLTTLAWQREGKRSYALEGSVFMAGATMDWLRDVMGLYETSSQTASMAVEAAEDSEVILVPAFQGLGAPWWNADVRGVLSGLSRATGKNELVRAGLESVVFQTVDLIEAFKVDCKNAGVPFPGQINVDGGMTANAWMMQFLSDMTNLPVQVAKYAETTALGSACFAFEKGEHPLNSLESGQRYRPEMDAAIRHNKYSAWQKAVSSLVSH